MLNGALEAYVNRRSSAQYISDTQMDTELLHEMVLIGTLITHDEALRCYMGRHCM